MKVIVIGATGTIGLPVCQALCRAGHIVYGVTRTVDKAKALVAEEIHPIIGDPASSWLHLIPTIDVVIQALGGGEVSIAHAIIKNLTSAIQQSRTAQDPKIALIQTSGTWLYGDNRKDVISDLTPLTLPNSTPLELVTARDMPGLEQIVLKSDVFRGIVVRPGLVYGRGGSILQDLFKAARDTGTVVGYGTPGARWSAVHTDDLADLYVRMAESATIIGGHTIIATSEILSADGFLNRLVEVSGAKGPVVYQEATTPFQKAMSSTQIARPHLARSLLGWSPRKSTLIDNLETYYHAYLATQPDEKSVQLIKHKFSLS